MGWLKRTTTEVCNNSESVYNETSTRSSLGLTRQEESLSKLAGSTTTFFASLCATSYGCLNFFKKDSNKVGAFISTIVGITGMAYSSHEAYVHYQSCKPYFK